MSGSFPPHTVTPAGYREFARVLGSAASAGRKVRIRGGATKLGRDGGAHPGMMHITTTRLTEASFTQTTATFGAGTTLAGAHASLARRGLMLALDPPRARDATLGGVVASADGGPLEHGYGGARDQVLDLLAALPDGSLVRASEYRERDLCSLLTGSRGTLAAILELTVRVHPLPANTTVVLGSSSDSTVLAAAAAAVSDGPVPVAALDYGWHNGTGGLLVMVGSWSSGGATKAAHGPLGPGPLQPPDTDPVPSAPSAADPSQTVAELIRAAGAEQVEVRTQGDRLWARQRAGQRSADRAVLRVRHRRDLMPQVLAAADHHSATAIGRAALACSYLTVDTDQLDQLREALPRGCHATVTDLPASARAAAPPRTSPPAATLDLMREVKALFDPADACNPGMHIGGI